VNAHGLKKRVDRAGKKTVEQVGNGQRFHNEGKILSASEAA
jgi:hypothetical protein